MQKKNFLAELGLEEIPAGYINNAVQQLKQKFQTALNEAKLTYDDLELFSTPRRFAIRINQLQVEQKDEVIESVGPPKKIAYDNEGKLTKAGSGFLRNAQATVDDIYFKKTPKGEKIAVKKKVVGKKTTAILQEIISDYISTVSFPKTMKWGKSKLVFARPLRWIVLLFGNEIIELNLENLKAGRTSFGNRFQKLVNPIKIPNAVSYEATLEQVKVIPNRKERLGVIEQQISRILRKNHKSLVKDENLLGTVTDLVEFPTAVFAEFNRQYLSLPEKVVTSTLSEHQKYFAVQDDGKLTNNFIFISNGNPINSDLIRTGNEKVIEARLADARFFFREDTKHKLEDYFSKLAEVTFQEKLGSLKDKTERIEQLCTYICDELGLENKIREKVLRAAHLCKTDLVTLMLAEKEFTKLQGYIGHRYALISGEDKSVARAIEEHYANKIEGMSLVGAIVAIADKIDTICGIIGVGMLPTGSKDPFALRRAAQNLVEILAEKNLELDIPGLIEKTYKVLKDKTCDREHEFVQNFMKKRIEWLLKQNHIEYDIIDSVTDIDHSNIPDLLNRAQALQDLKQKEDFITLVLAFKRVSNIIVKAKIAGKLDKSLLGEPQEKALYEAYIKLEKEINELLPDKDYNKILQKLIDFGKLIDKFFDDVLVNVEDQRLKQNRYKLLDMIRKLFLKVADISKIVVEGENKR